MSDPMIMALARLLEVSLNQWQLTGAVHATGQGITVQSKPAELSIERAPDGMPFRWVLVIDERKRTAASVGGVLRIVRQTLAPGYVPFSLRIAPTPVVPLPVQQRDAP